jgi:WD40 repeat protein
MADQWFVARNNKKHGPFTAAKLKELAKQGRLFPTDMLHKEGMQKWVAASSVKGLFTGTTARPASVKKASKPEGDEFQFNDRQESDDKPTPKRRATSVKGLLILGAAGGGVLLMTLLVVALVVVFRGRGEGRGGEKNTQVADGGGGGTRNEGDADSKDESSRITRTAHSHVLLLEKPDRCLKNTVGVRCAFTPDGKALVVSLKDGDEFVPKSRVAIIDAVSEEVISDKLPLSKRVSSLRALLLPAEKQAARLDALEVAMHLPEKDRNPAAVKSVIVAVGGAAEYVAVQGDPHMGLENPTVEIWNLETRTQVQLEPVAMERQETFGNLAFSPDARYLARATTRKKVHVWVLPSGKLSKSLDFGIGRHLMFSPDGKWLLTQQWRDEAKRNKSDQLVLWNTQDWGKKHAIKPPGEKWDYNLGALCAFSSDGKLLATTNDETGYIRLVTIWDVQTGELRKGFETVQFADLAFSPDGKLLATWGGRLPLSIWDVESGQIKCKFPFAASPQSFSPDGRFLTLATAEGGLIYDLTKGRQVPYVDPVQKERDRLAKDIDITKPAPPITKAKYDQIRVGMTRFHVMRLLGGAGETVKKDTFKRKEGKFGYSVIYRDTQKYAGAGGGHALFDYEGASTDTPLVRKQEFGLK